MLYQSPTVVFYRGPGIPEYTSHVLSQIFTLYNLKLETIDIAKYILCYTHTHPTYICNVLIK